MSIIRVARGRLLAKAWAIALVLLWRSPTFGGERVPPASDAEAWRALPKAEVGEGSALPNWAKATATALPRTTAAMLDLDRLHRTKSPLGPSLRGKMRWIAADANHCAYSRSTAEADLRRAGVGDAEIARLQAGYDRWAPDERDALQFAHDMTVGAGAITDAEVELLRGKYGEEKLVAMVLLLAAANFQDRILLALAIPLEDGGPLPPPEIRWSRAATPPAVPTRAKPIENAGAEVPVRVDDPEWNAVKFDVLQKNLDSQRANDGRIRVPTFEEVLKVLPAGYPKPKSPVRIRWSLVCLGYQPELAAAWSACTRSFGEEANQDRVFEESLFWVVTRTIHCFY